ncbi:MAG: hypothetical protein UX72_C0001G0064 [Parcubacteria group bacterium GW2011_GWA2_47_10]|nr:MAG: hypothetical protein UX72_C0001G0064 [Parcubacteria group bacterium GW2011_GWA2_47_10]
MKRFALGVLLIIGIALFSAPSVRAQGEEHDPNPAPPAGGYYELQDLYYWDKSGNKTLLLLYPKAVVVRLRTEQRCDEGGCVVIEPEENKKAFSDFLIAEKLTPADGAEVESTEGVLGTDEAKLPIVIRKYYVITMPEKTDYYIFSLVNRLVQSGVAVEAHPVFLVNDDLVFPAGFWTKSKLSSGKFADMLKKKIQSNGYEKVSIDRMMTSKVSSQLSYFTQAYEKDKPGAINPVRMSRLVAEDSISVEWAVPDFVSIRKAITADPKAIKPSATFGDPMTASFVITYNEKKFVVDVPALTAMNAANIRPNGLYEELFKLDQVAIREEPGKVYIDLAFRVYQRGDFILQLPPVFYRVKGSPQDVPPLQFKFPSVTVKIVGLVPRDSNGNPLLKDIFPWKRMPVFTTPALAKPERTEYPVYDLRYYTESLLKTVPNVSLYLKRAGFFCIVSSLLWFGWVLVWQRVESVRRRELETIEESDAALEREYRLAKSGLIVAVRSGTTTLEQVRAYVVKARMELRRVLGFAQGSTERDMLKEVSPVFGKKLGEALGILTQIKEAGIVVESDIAKVHSLFVRLRLMRKFEWFLRLWNRVRPRGAAGGST